MGVGGVCVCVCVCVCVLTLLRVVSEQCVFEGEKASPLGIDRSLRCLSSHQRNVLCCSSGRSFPVPESLHGGGRGGRGDLTHVTAGPLRLGVGVAEEEAFVGDVVEHAVVELARVHQVALALE